MNETEGLIPYKNVIFSDPVDIASSIPLENLKGKVILITGGASGIGAACVREWAQHGANVIVGDIDEQKGIELIAKIRKESKNSNHHFLPLNVTSWLSQASFFKQAASLSPHGGLDCVVANAGICDVAECLIFENPPDYSSMENPEQPKMRTLDVNLSGVMYTTTLAISYLSRNPGSEKCSLTGRGAPRDRHLVLVSSVAGVAAFPSESIYGASKHAVVGLFRALRVNSPITHGIRINMINPYFVDTPILGPTGTLFHSGGTMVQIEDVVEAATRLVADQSVIGRALMIGTRAYAEQAKAAGLQTPEGLSKPQAIWDVYGHDFEQTDFFGRRIIGVINIVTTARGWIGILQDVAAWMVLPITRLVRR